MDVERFKDMEPTANRRYKENIKKYLKIWPPSRGGARNGSGDQRRGRGGMLRRGRVQSRGGKGQERGRQRTDEGQREQRKGRVCAEEGHSMRVMSQKLMRST